MTYIKITISIHWVQSVMFRVHGYKFLMTLWSQIEDDGNSPNLLQKSSWTILIPLRYFLYNACSKHPTELFLFVIYMYAE